MTTRARAFYLLKKLDKNDLKRLGHPIFIRLSKIRFNSPISNTYCMCVQWFHNSHKCVYNGVFTVVCKVHNLQLLANTLLVLQQQNGNASANFTMSILLVSVCNSQYSQHTFEEWHVQISQCQACFLSIPLFSSFRRVGTSELWLEFHILALPC